MQAVSQRNQYLDYTKGILILLVVYGHTIQYIQCNQNDFFDNAVFKAIYIFHMPLFMAISGFLAFSSIQKNTFSILIKKRFYNLVVPILSWSIIIISTTLSLKQLAIVLSLKQFKKNELLSAYSFFYTLVNDTILHIVNEFWFLWALFFSGLIVFLIKSIGKDNIYGLVLMCCLLFVIPDIGNMALLQYTFPFFCFGYLAAKNKTFPKFLDSKKCALIVSSSFVLTIIGYILWNEQTYIYVSKMSNLYLVALRYVAGAATCISMLYLFHKLYLFSHASLRNFLCKMGAGSLYIYILQSYFFELISKFQYPSPSNFLATALIYPALAILLSFCFFEIGSLSKYNALAAKLLFGRI
jgi:fucose 4-O-acetylase-like acetyltransferase